MTDVLARGKWPEVRHEAAVRRSTRSRTARIGDIKKLDDHQATVRRCFVLCVRLSPSCYPEKCSDWLGSSAGGVAVHCADCGSSNSDITEPCSPLSTTSLDDMPPTVVSRSPAPPNSVLRRPLAPPSSPVADNASVQWPWTDPPNKRPKQGKITEYFRAKGSNNKGCILASANVAALNKESSLQQSWVTSPVSKFLSSSVKSGVSLVPTALPGTAAVKVGAGDDDEDEEEEEEDSGLQLDQTPCHFQLTTTNTSTSLDMSCDSSSTIGVINKETDNNGPSPVILVATSTPTVVANTTACNISADNAEENSSSGASDVSSLFTSRTTTDSDSTRQQRQQEEERTIRFPVINGWRGHYVSDVVCRWTDCEAKFATSTALLEHLQVNHVNSQTLSENYVCRWANCKVYDRKSCSRTWLERHVLSHGGNKPYRCIVDGCGHRFSSQTLLQRHVNNHFSERDQKGDSKKGCESANKLIRRNGKKLRYRRQPFSARIYDYFDSGIMEGLQHNLIELTERRTQGHFDNVPGDNVLLQSRILGRKMNQKGETEVLLRWFPENIVSDEWVRLNEVTRTKTVPIRRLPVQAKDILFQYLLNHRRNVDSPQWLDRRRRRKQPSNNFIKYPLNYELELNGCGRSVDKKSNGCRINGFTSSPSSNSSSSSTSLTATSFSSTKNQTLPSSVPPSKTTALSTQTT